jgi:Zn-dependent alcohol dehydrogenase
MVEALVCLTFGGPFERRLVKMGEMREDEIIVRMVATGVCFTDLAATRVRTNPRTMNLMLIAKGCIPDCNATHCWSRGSRHC